MTILSSGLERLRGLIFPDSDVRYVPTWYNVHNTMLQKYALYEKYYSGDVFKELADPEAGQDSPLKYPLKINLCAEWSDMLSTHMLGQWDESVVSHSVRRREQESGNIADEEERRCSSMEDVLMLQWHEQGNDARLAAALNDMMVYGGFVNKVRWDNLTQTIEDEWLSPDMFIPRWHPTNAEKLLTVYIAYSISRDDARDIFNLSQAQWQSLPVSCTVWEMWTDKEFVMMVEKIEVRSSRVNPMGFIPHTYIPRKRVTPVNFGYYGVSPLEYTMAVQDEVNLRAADIGDGVAYSSHPIRVVRNVTSKDDLHVGPDALWDLGIGMGGRQPDAFSLDTKTNYKEGMEFISSIEKYGRELTRLPPIAFGEDEGSQRSGTTLLIRFLPLTQDIKVTRLYLALGLRERAKKILKLAASHSDSVSGVRFAEEDVNGRFISPTFAPILPKDMSDMVNEWAIRIESGFGTPEEAYRALGHKEPELAAKNAEEYLERVAKREKILRGVQPNASRNERARPKTPTDNRQAGGRSQASKSSG